MLSQLTTVIMGAVTGASGGDCPTEAAVAGELQRLGALAAVSELGTAQVSVSGNVLSIVMRDHQEGVLGTRSLESPPSCEARAAVAAVL